MKNTIESKWEEIKERVRQDNNMSDVSFRTFLEPLQINTINNNILTIIIDVEKQGSNPKMISDRIELPLKVAIEEETGFNLNLEYILSTEVQNQSVVEEDSEDILIGRYPFLSSGHSFDNFVVSGCNSMARAACLNVAEDPFSSDYNPLYIYGGSGLGKTHLLHSIVRYIATNDPSKKILYTTCEQFTNELIEAIRNTRSSKDSTATFDLRNKYRNVDVLLIDDIQFMIGKDSTQEEFFHTFNELYEAGKQIIISSDKPPKEMTNLEERLRSRFAWGLPVDIQPPDYETSMAILRKRQESDSYKLDDKILQFIATNIKSNVRDLEGALNRIIMFAKFQKKEATISLAEEALNDMVSPEDNVTVNMDMIIDIVAEHFGITKDNILSKKRSKDIAEARFICFYLSFELTKVTKTAVADKFGRDHSSVINGINKVVQRMAVDNDYKNTIDIIIKKINP